jgi:hypothetical protein
MAVVVEVLHHILVSLLVVLEDDGLDGRVALDQDSYSRIAALEMPEMESFMDGDKPLTALGMAAAPGKF